MLYLIRHGESQANRQGIYQGQSYDTDLTELGRFQALAVAQELSSCEIGKIVASSLKRTYQTAEPLAWVLHQKIRIESQVVEINHGRWEGKAVKEFNKVDRKILNNYKRDPTNVQMPNGEHTQDVSTRVLSWFERMKDQQESMAVFTHDFIIRILVSYLLNRTLARAWEIELDNAGITTVDLKNNQILELNKTKHLLSLRSDVTVQAL